MKQKCKKCGGEFDTDIATACPYCNEPVSIDEKPLPEPEIKELRRIIEKSAYEFKTGTFKRSILFGTGAAIISSVVWFVLIIATDRELGLIALVAGWLIGWAVFLGGWQGKKTQIIGCLLAISAVILGKFLYIYWITPDMIKIAIKKTPEIARDVEVKRSFLVAIRLFLPYLKISFSIVDIIFLLGAGYEGWIVPKRCAMKAVLIAMENIEKEKKL
jgi:DNA-directed RNA polymerase subunit RPC12/RpoP